MLMRVRNGLFKVVSRMIEASSRVKYGVMAGTEEGNQWMQQQLDQNSSIQKMDDYVDNTINVYKQGKSTYQQNKIDVYAQYLKNQMKGKDAHSVLEQIDRIELIRNIESIEQQVKDSGDYDLEQLQYEKLRVQALLGEPDSISKYEEYVKNRAFKKEFNRWSDGEEGLRHGYLK